MDTQPALPNPPSALSRRLSVVAAREHGVGPEQLPLIGIDPDIFDVFYREHIDGVEGFVVRRVGDRERAAELTAEIFLAAIDSSHRYRPALGTPRAWLLGIARILVAGERRQRDRQRAGEERLRGSALVDHDDAARWDARIDAATRSRELYQAMDRLPDGERAVLELVALDELSLAETAAATGIRPVTARVRLHRARRRLRAELEAAADQPNPRREDRS
ncbi:MAG TPA: sigma-70 family RNA polymerase sigma factor [Solirubrobacterales bacterium]|jgi:RNA polymerase sigma-70 factor (ECF subfamily)